MKIEIDEKDYKILLKNVAIWNWVHEIMSDMVDSKYKKESAEWSKLIDTLLKYTDDKSVKDTFDWKNVFEDDYVDWITELMVEYDNYVVEELTGINVEQIENELEDERNNPLFVK